MAIELRVLSGARAGQSQTFQKSTVTIGRLRPCPILDYKFIALGHNTIRGAAGVAILNAELMHRDGFL